jgi:hypothetical protein
MRQRMELTRTNRSCGLTTYFSCHLELALQVVGATDVPTSDFEARREKVKVVTQSYRQSPNIPIETLV